MGDELGVHGFALEAQMVHVVSVEEVPKRLGSGSFQSKEVKALLETRAMAAIGEEQREIRGSGEEDGFWVLFF